MCGICECACAGICGLCAATIVLVVFYFFFGIIFIVLASHAKSAVALYSDLVTFDVSLFPNLCIVIGILFTLLTLMGVWGEQKGRKTRIVYTVAQLLVVILGLYIYIDAYPNEKKLEKHIYQGMNSSLHDYGLDVMAGSKSITEDWDKMQESLECCGVNNFLDWEGIRPHGQYSPPTPISCCKREHRMTGCSSHVRFDHPAESGKIVNVQGCLPQVRDQILGTMQLLHWFLVPILIMVCIGILNSCCSSGVKKSTEMETKTMGPIVIRVKKRKTEPTSYDVEAAEKSNLQPNDDDEGGTEEDTKGENNKEVEMQKLNPDGTSAEGKGKGKKKKKVVVV